MARTQKTSFNILSVPVAKYGSAHIHQNPEHRAGLDYIHSGRTHLNERWDREILANGRPKTLKNYLADTKKAVKEKTGRAMQKKAEDNVIGEAVVVIDEQTTMDDLLRLAKAMENQYGWTCAQIHIHRDEGYLGKRSEEMKHREGKYNLHAHIFFVTTNLANGKSWKRKKGEGSRMQDITAQVLNLTRGKRKSERSEEVKETLNVVEFKEEQARKKVEVLEKKIEENEERAKEALRELEEVEEDILSSEEIKADTERKIDQIRDILREVEEEKAAALKPTQELQMKSYQEIIDKNTKKYIFGAVSGTPDYKAISEELWEQQRGGAVAIATNQYLDTRRYKEERDKAVREGTEAMNELQTMKRKYSQLVERVVDAMGERFQRFWLDVKKFGGEIAMALGLWSGDTWENKTLEEEYTADKDRCLLLINGKSQDEREEEFVQLARIVHKRAVETSGEGWAMMRFQKLAKMTDYHERMRELKDIAKTAGRGRGIRR